MGPNIILHFMNLLIKEGIITGAQKNPIAFLVLYICCVLRIIIEKPEVILWFGK